jgi:hypothetical protein
MRLLVLAALLVSGFVLASPPALTPEQKVAFLDRADHPPQEESSPRVQQYKALLERVSAKFGGLDTLSVADGASRCQMALRDSHKSVSMYYILMAMDDGVPAKLLSWKDYEGTLALYMMAVTNGADQSGATSVLRKFLGAAK